MAGFADLSIDLLYVIFSHLQWDKSQLHDIALSCRLFRDISQRFIVKDVGITHSPTRSRSKLFLRTLEERPDLIVHVHRLELDLLREDIHWPEEQDNIHRITRLLTNLRELCYTSRDYKVWHYDLPFPLKWTEEKAHDHVRRVEWHHNMSVGTLSKCMKLPRIESIYCRELHAPTVQSLDLHAIAADVSSLTELRIGSSIGLPAEPFRAVMRMPLNLRKLVLDFHEQYRDGPGADRIAWLLEPVQGTLEELSITIRKGMFSPAGYAAEFSAFTSLKKLSIPCRHLFGHGILGPLQIQRLLPPRLTQLKLSFVASGRANDTSAAQNFDALAAAIGDMHEQSGMSATMPDLNTIILEESKCRSYHGDLLAESVKLAVGSWRAMEDSGFGRLRIRYQPEGDA